MKYAIIIAGMIIFVALAGMAVSQTKRLDCLQNCRADGDVCAEKAYREHAQCNAEPSVCAGIKTAALRRCQVIYDACRYECDVSRF